MLRDEQRLERARPVPRHDQRHRATRSAAAGLLPGRPRASRSAGLDALSPHTGTLDRSAVNPLITCCRPGKPLGRELAADIVPFPLTVSIRSMSSSRTRASGLISAITVLFTSTPTSPNRSAASVKSAPTSLRMLMSPALLPRFRRLP
jgi:hypothetical protein